jgi:isocitrate dehydrogenase
MSQMITYRDGRLQVPDVPVIPYIPGDGIGPEVWAAARPVLEATVAASYGSRRAIDWLELPAGQKALSQGLDLLPAATIAAIREHRVAIKGPTMTPVGGGHRSINVALRQALDLYANVRPVRYFEGVEAPVKNPAALDVVIFRENTEDVYAGIEFAAGSPEGLEFARLLAERGHPLREDTGIGIKIISRVCTRRLVRAAIEYALARGARRVTLVHKGNIMKATEGAFRAWGYELVREAYAGRAVVQEDLAPGRPAPEGMVVVDDRIADAAFQDLLLHPERFQVLAAPRSAAWASPPGPTSATAWRCSNRPMARRPTSPGAVSPTPDR